MHFAPLMSAQARLLSWLAGTRPEGGATWGFAKLMRWCAARHNRLVIPCQAGKMRSDLPLQRASPA